MKTLLFESNYIHLCAKLRYFHLYRAFFAENVTLTIKKNDFISSKEMESSMSLLELASKGGWIMIVLGIMSVLAIYIFFERFIAIRKASKSDPLFMERIRDYMKEKDMDYPILLIRFLI